MLQWSGSSIIPPKIHLWALLNLSVHTTLCDNCEKMLIFNRGINGFQVQVDQKILKGLYWNPSIYNIICWYVGRSDKWLVDQVSDVPSITLFFIKSCNILYKNPFNLFSNFFCKITKMKIKSFECPKSYKKLWKKK